MTNHSPVENLPVVTYNSLPVITTDMLAKLYNTEPKYIQTNTARNESRFVAGKHFFKLEGAELKDFKNRPSLRGLVGSRARSLVLWTERGAARHAKMLETDQAWEVFESLEDFYFSQKEKAEQVRKNRQCTATQLIPLRQTAERLITTGLGKIYPDIWKLVHQRFDVEHIHQLQPEQVSEAIEYLNVLEGEYLEKQQPPSLVEFENDYSMNFFKPYYWIFGGKFVRSPSQYDPKLLIPTGDYPSPCAKLFHELEKKGVNIDAARFQLQSLQHHLEISLHRISNAQTALLR